MLIEFTATFSTQDDENSQDEENAGNNETPDPQALIIVVERVVLIFSVLRSERRCHHKGAAEDKEGKRHDNPGWSNTRGLLSASSGLWVGVSG